MGKPEKIWFISSVGIMAIAVIGAVLMTDYTENGPPGKMPDGFNFSDSKKAVERVAPIPCHSTENQTHTDTYRFECNQTISNHTYVMHYNVEHRKNQTNRVVVHP